MDISRQAQAILLLTAYLPKSAKADARPLSPREWARLSCWLGARGLGAEHLQAQGGGVLEGWRDSAVTVDRIERLLDREAALAGALERWLRAGLWVLTAADPGYPGRFRRRLGADAPPLLFGSGNPALLDLGGLAVVGTREAGAHDLEYSRGLGRLAARQGHALVSGGARGVDEAAMLAALEAGGRVVGVLGDGLLAATASARFRARLQEQSLALVSPFYPEAGFSPGNAMARNKHIYCLADAAAVVRSGLKGGTWSGALENLRHGWVPLWVRDNADETSGNGLLIEAGGRWLPTPLAKLDLAGLFEARHVAEAAGGAVPDSAPGAAEPVPSAVAGPAEEALDSLYACFLVHAQRALRQEAQTLPQLAEALELHKAQLQAWLRRALAEGRVQALSRPKRYRWRTDENRQLQLFEEGRRDD
jgi:predicted Rossmann fold nucleotide-binding protein DprA/Smf involved in DNA uptake